MKRGQRALLDALPFYYGGYIDISEKKRCKREKIL